MHLIVIPFLVPEEVGGDRLLIVQAHMNVQAVRLGVVAFGTYIYFVYLHSLWNLIFPVIVYDSLGMVNCYG